MPPAFAYVIDELIHVDYSDENKKVYYDEIIRSIIDSEMGAEFIEALCNPDPEPDHRQSPYHRRYL